MHSWPDENIPGQGSGARESSVAEQGTRPDKARKKGPTTRGQTNPDKAWTKHSQAERPIAHGPGRGQAVHTDPGKAWTRPWQGGEERADGATTAIVASLCFS